jgi:hypothetical protein
MNCEKIREMMPDVAAGMMADAPEVEKHLAGCAGCAGQLEQFRQTMALLDEWQVPEPSPYFDVRLQARLREEKARTAAGWLGWLRKPALAAALTVVLAAGITMFTRGPAGHEIGGNIPGWTPKATIASATGTAVGDLQSLDKNHDMFSEFDLLDDLAAPSDQTANP